MNSLLGGSLHALPNLSLLNGICHNSEDRAGYVLVQWFWCQMSEPWGGWLCLCLVLTHSFTKAPPQWQHCKLMCMSVCAVKCRFTMSPSVTYPGWQGSTFSHLPPWLWSSSMFVDSSCMNRRQMSHHMFLANLLWFQLRLQVCIINRIISNRVRMWLSRAPLLLQCRFLFAQCGRDFFMSCLFPMTYQKTDRQ